MTQIPSLDISLFEQDKAAFINAFHDAYSYWGFAGIQGHSIAPSLIKDAFSSAESFFALPNEIKSKYETNVAGKARGYIPFGTEKAKGSKHSDLKEFYHIGREVPEVEYLKSNLWPAEVANFEQSFDTLFKALDKLANQILEVVALTIGLPQYYFENKVDRGEALLRVLHYPPIKEQDIPNLRAAAHEDINLLTLLVGSEQDGLQVLSRQGQWVPINMIEGTIICNVGDMLQRLTNNTLPSTTHRVVNPKGASARMSRYSIPFFMHPNPDVKLDCLPQCVSEQNPAQYPPITAQDYLNERLHEIGLLKK